MYIYIFNNVLLQIVHLSKRSLKMEKDPRSQIKCIHLEVRHYDVLMYDDELYDHKLYAGCQNISLSNCFQNVLRNKCLGIIFRPNVTFMYYFF